MRNFSLPKITRYTVFGNAMVTLITGSQILKKKFGQCFEFSQGKTLSRGVFDEYSFKQLRRETRGQWQKCYGEASMSIYL